MRKYNINSNLVRTTEQRYDQATGAVQMTGSTEEWIIRTARAKQGFFFTPLFNIFLECTMYDALGEMVER